MAIPPNRDGLSAPYSRGGSRWNLLPTSDGYIQQDQQPFGAAAQQGQFGAYPPQGTYAQPLPQPVPQPGQVIYSNSPYFNGGAAASDQFVAPQPVDFNQQQVAMAGFGPQQQPINTGTMQYTGQAGRFLYSVDDGPNSDYLQCVYRPDRLDQPNIVELCEKVQDCCSEGCCPKDQFWMGGVYVLIAVVIVVAVVGFAIAIVCYLRSRGKSRRDEEYDRYGAGTGYAGSHVGYPYGPYGSSIGPPSAKY